MSFFNQGRYQVAPDETGSAENQNFHLQEVNVVFAKNAGKSKNKKKQAGATCFF
jgi:hypothetical protein